MLRLVRRMLALFLLLTLGACTLSSPDDLRFESVEAVQLSKVPGIWGGERVEGVNKEAIWLAKVRFSSTQDLLKFSRTESLDLTYQAALCNEQSLKSREIFVFPLWRIGTYTHGDFSRPELDDLEQFREPDGRLTYHAFIPIAGAEVARAEEKSRSSSRNYFFYTASSKSVCLEVRGVHMIPVESSLSNTVKVPAAQMQRVMEQVKLGGGGS